MEYAVASKAAVGQGLRVVFKCVGRRFGSGIRNGQRQIVFFEHEVDARSGALDGAGDYVSGDPQPLRVCVVAHAVQFFDGDVVTLAVLDAGVGEIAKREQNKDGDRSEFKEFAASLDIKWLLL